MNGTTVPPAPASNGDEAPSSRLARFLDEEWEWMLGDQPESATLVGDSRFNDRLTDFSPEAIDRRRAHAREAIGCLDRIPREPLGAEDRISHDFYRRELALTVDGARFPEELAPITQQNGIQKDFAILSSLTPFRGADDYRAYLARLAAFSTQVDQVVALLARGKDAGWTPPRGPLAAVPRAIRAQLVGEAEESPHFRPFVAFPETVSGTERQRLCTEARAVIAAKVFPAYARLLEFFVEDYLPFARTTTGACALPDGEAYYDFKIRQETTLDLSAEEIHRIGLGEVERIRGEMTDVARRAGFSGTFSAFFRFLRTDPRFYYDDAEELLRGYRDICKRLDPQLARFFGTLPRLPYGVLPTPDFEAPSSTTAYYRPGSPEAPRPGYFVANTWRLETRPRYEMEALAAHESVPGHHIQIALAMELDGTPRFRRYGAVTAFIEGWALYAEGLAEEMGMYADRYSKFGQLTYEMWRAIRLVLDTGIHALEWERPRAIDFFRQNAAKTEHDIEVEVDRYTVWPAQALAYKLGELKIRELRRRAERELAGRFDVRRFHDAVLLSGPLPLSILESKIDRWIEGEKRAEPPARP